ncbi:methyltransferase domain-containing protein [Candidatus Woesearchaeota archaeon]|jgi:tRNA (guanine10-N2)-dimethyltransferase|nr:methyltransferase domain-containing protein [Candidatus Woesearchaeota archaeon]MBT7063003.1 methyltransferase domain-containing protein [Candidatus Woesearchaeota archaeon]MBT7402586.1 methyltransferase domain-containing protein [Candidatus Woesearchaeota archaeon]
MKYIFKLSGENYNLAKFELETLLNKKLKRNKDSVSIDLPLSTEQINKICNRSAMIQKCYTNNLKIWAAKSDKRFVARVPKKKPKQHPAMLKPKMARLLVNLTNAKKQILDPFCGTGSILIEAGILGLKPIGSDIDSKMIEYSKINTKQFKVKSELKQLDATQLETNFKNIEAIACDPPYGISSTLAGKKMQDLYPDFLTSANKILKKGSRLVMVRPHYLKLGVNKDWKKLGEFDWYMHKGLTRKILVLEKRSATSNAK